MSGGRGSEGPIRFAEKLLVLLDQGTKTATYKYAVLVALMDLCLEHSDRGGGAPTMVTTAQLADKIVELYWGHTRPFERGETLRQNTGGQARILRLISDFQGTCASGASSSRFRASQGARVGFDALRREVEWKLVEMPLPRLQRIGAEESRFIYDIHWTDRVTRGQFNGADFDNRILLVGQAAEHLVQMAGILRPLIYRQWAAMVASLNKLPDWELERFLFGQARENLEPVRAPLLDVQGGACFYCRGGIRKDAHVDHFLPWARHPDNGLDNLVVAHQACNLAKRDFLAADAHVLRWSKHLLEHGDALDRVATDAQWERHPARTISVVRAVYARLPDDVRLWRAKGEFVGLRRGSLESAFAALGRVSPG